MQNTLPSDYTQKEDYSCFNDSSNSPSYPPQESISTRQIDSSMLTMQQYAPSPATGYMGAYGQRLIPLSPGDYFGCQPIPSPAGAQHIQDSLLTSLMSCARPQEVHQSNVPIDDAFWNVLGLNVGSSIAESVRPIPDTNVSSTQMRRAISDSSLSPQQSSISYPTSPPLTSYASSPEHMPSPQCTPVPDVAASMAIDETYMQQGYRRVRCRWQDCAGSFIEEPSGRSFRQHFAAFHPVSSRSRNVDCGWGGCGQRVQCLPKHIKAHSPERCICTRCGDALKRADAVKRHQENGSCTRCPFCSRSLDSVEQKKDHVLVCTQRLRK